MSNYQQHLYEVNYPDGGSQLMDAHMIYLGNGIIGLKTAPGDNPGNLIFAAAHESGVTITLVAEEDTPS